MNFLIFLSLFLLPQQIFAKDIQIPTQITNINKTYQKTQSEYQTLIKKIPSSIRRNFDKPNSRQTSRLSNKYVTLKKQYLELRAKKENIDYIYDLKEALNKMYLTKYPHANLKALNQESSLIATQIIPEISRLKEKYHIFGFPILHNMMIDVGARKRGACKHWAEDLLDFLKPMQRNYFWITWGEAYPGKLHEHNVAVIYPKETTFNDGMMIDPWRTAGKPFWLKVTQDKKYKWNPWEYYGVY